jgi:hypothetical protein
MNRSVLLSLIAASLFIHQGCDKQGTGTAGGATGNSSAAGGITATGGRVGAGTYHRMVAVDKLNFNADGTIQKVTPGSGLTF